jgi:hypothetical protein
MENLDLKKILIGLTIVFGLGGLGLYLYNPSQETNQNYKNEKKIMEEVGVKNFIRNDLTDLEKQEFENLLGEYENKKKEMKAILEKAYKDGNMEDA